MQDERIDAALNATAERLQDNYPYFHPLYAGQMLKPPHPIARVAYALAQWINPNNHALDGGRASSAMEKEAVAQIAQMLGWQKHLGHLTSGGLKLSFESVPADSRGRMNIQALKDRLSQGGVGTVVATIGTTATGSVDPLAEILDLEKEFDFRVHADAAYGGYFSLVDNLDVDARRAFDQIARVDSI